MDKINNYKYALGTADQLRQGDLDSMLVAEDLSDLQFKPSKSLILNPEFIGVYQDEELLFSRGEETRQSLFNRFNPAIQEFLANNSNMALMYLKGKEDPIHSRLIHVFYDPANWNKELVKICLADPFERVAISDINQKVDFSEKNIKIALSILFEDAINRGSAEEYLKKSKERIEEIISDSSKYGLMRTEYVVLQALREGYKDNPKSKNTQLVLEALKEMISRNQRKD